MRNVRAYGGTERVDAPAGLNARTNFDFKVSVGTQPIQSNPIPAPPPDASLILTYVQTSRPAILNAYTAAGLILAFWLSELLRVRSIEVGRYPNHRVQASRSIIVL